MLNKLTQTKQGEKMVNTIVEEKLSYKLAMKNITIGNKVYKINNTYFLKWYGKFYSGETKDDVLNKVPAIQYLKKSLNLKGRA
tara:strand:- start:1040 stop:1288 length:249 start_codon:yes stop_codon:yes gene_type:complete